jgi:hypothetical protein
MVALCDGKGVRAQMADGRFSLVVDFVDEGGRRSLTWRMRLLSYCSSAWLERR